jgi:threonyl-tRNA synthetase
MSLRAGVNTSCGAGSVMMYNVQWDETNGERFDIRSHNGGPIGILHTTLLGGVKALPILIGRALAGLRPRRFPLALAPVQLYLVPVRADHSGLARRLERRLTAAGVRVRVAAPDGGSLSRRIAVIRRQWGPYVSVLGDAERDGAVAVRDLSGSGHVSLDVFVRAIRAHESFRDRRLSMVQE